MQAATIDSPPSPLDSELRRVRELLERSQFANAVYAARAALDQAPANRDLLYMLAVGQRYQNRIPDALETLARLEALYPNYSRSYQERGHCHVALRAAEPAIAAFEQAVRINPALPASWQALSVLYRMTGQPAASETASAHVAKLGSLPVEIVTATSMFADGEVHEAERLVRQFLLSHGDHVEGMRLLARIGIHLDILDDAELLLEGVLNLAPDYVAARVDYAVVLSKRHRNEKALEEIAKLRAAEPDNRLFTTLEANAYAGLGHHDEALERFRELTLETPDNPELHVSVGHALKTLGRQSEAIAAYRAATAARPGYGDAYWSLANLKTYRFTDDELAQMREREAAPATAVFDRYHLCFALGKALEDRSEYAESFRYYERGNALKRAECRYNADTMTRNLHTQAAVLTREFFAARSGWGCDRADPIFIVGLPRSGSTLLEQVLASHSKVEGTMELAEITRLVHQLSGHGAPAGHPGYPAVLAELPAERFSELGEKFLADTRAYRSGKPYFIDKNPNNFRHLGLIHLMLPNARIIDARREAMACCFGNFKQLFASGQEFTYSLEDIARYYRSYVELMEHWQQVLPGRILRVQHEDVVQDLEGNARRMLDFLGLDFEPQCLEFYKTERSVRTASSEQVRQPLFKEGLDQWRHYDPWLGPLRSALGPLAS